MIFSPLAKRDKTGASFMQKVFLSAFGLFLCVILLELGLRAGGFIFLYFQEHKNTVSARQKSSYRILCLGESTTANTWPRILEDILNRKNTGIKFSVIDKGVPGITTPLIVNQLENNLYKYNPDMVIAMIGINDAVSVVKDKDAIAEIKPSPLFGSFRVFKLIKFIHSRIISKTDKAAFVAAPEKGGDYVSKKDPACPAVIKDINPEAIAADPYAGLITADKAWIKKLRKTT